MSEKPKIFTVTELRVEQWETEYTVKELGISGTEQSGLIQELSSKLWDARAMIRKQLDALKIAREAMNERHAYLRDQWDYKYGSEWDNEDGVIDDTIKKTEEFMK